MYKILLISRSQDENMILERRIEPAIPNVGPIHFLSAHPSGMVSSLDKGVTMVIVNLPIYKKEHISIVTTLRNAGFAGPVVILAKPDNIECVIELKKMRFVAFIEKPYDLKDLPGIVIKFAHARRVAQRIYRRFPTQQTAEVEIQGTTERKPMTLCNLSKSGAYFEVQLSQPIAIGDMLRVTIPLSEMNRTYSVPARVVWTSVPSILGGEAGVGVEFVGAADISKQLV